MMSASLASSAPPSTITIASLLARDHEIDVGRALCSNVGNATSSPSTRATRTPAIGPFHGMSERESAALAPDSASTSVGFSRSDDKTVAMTCVSFLKPSGNSGRSGRSIKRDDRTSAVAQAAFALEEAAGDLAGGVGLLDVLTGEREEVEPGTLLGRHRGDEHDALTVGHQDRAVGQLGKAPGLEGERTPTNHDGFTNEHVKMRSSARTTAACGTTPGDERLRLQPRFSQRTGRRPRLPVEASGESVRGKERS